MKCWLLSTLLCLAPLASQAGKLYWTDRNTGKVQRSDLDGQNLETLLEVDSKNLRGIAIDVADNRLYFADNQANTLSRATLDGEDVQTLVRNLGFPADVTLDLANRKLYWCDQNRNVIERANLDGSAVETVIETPAPYYLELDVPNNQLYWGDFFTGNINVRPLSGGDTVNLITGQSRIRGVKLDRAQNELFWCNRQSNHIQRRQVTGGPIKTVITDLDTPHGLVIDPIARKAYWCDTGTDNHNNGGRAINRTDLDIDSPLETVASLSQPWDADLDLRTTSYAQYLARYATIGSTAPPEGDLDGDGSVQLIEYATTSHPQRKDLSPQTKVEVTSNGPEFIYQRFANTSDLAIQIEISSNLKTWESNNGPTSITGTEQVESLGHGVVRVSVPIIGKGKHVRLRAILSQ